MDIVNSVYSASDITEGHSCTRFFLWRAFGYTRSGECLLFCACPVRSMANHVDPSFTDEGAADETDEVELQVRCLTGEGITFSVSRSMLGSDLRRLVSEKLPCKPGAKLVVHHVNGQLKLDENLAEQGIAEKSAMLSCTYIPTNVYTAWLYVFGYASELLNCEREFALEGVTHLQGDIHPEYLHHLPSSLASMAFDPDFNHSLEWVTLPSSLQSLSFGEEFDQSLERVTLPWSLKSLSFGFAFNHSLKRVTLPWRLESLSFGFEFDQSLQRVTLEGVKLPWSLKSLSFEYVDKALPLIKSLKFGRVFNQSPKQVNLPWGL